MINYTGAVSEGTIWKGASLDTSEVSILFNSGRKHIPIEIDPTNIVAHWGLDNVADGAPGHNITLVDSSGQGHDVVCNDGANNLGCDGVAEEMLTYP